MFNEGPGLVPLPPVTTITPFTYREGVTLLRRIRSIELWVREFVPELNEEFDSVYNAIKNQHENWLQFFTEFMQNVTNEIATLGDESIAQLIGSEVSATYQALEEWIFPKVSAVGDKRPVTYYYVSSSIGDDANPGTEELPFKTIQKALDSIPMLIKNDHWVKIFPGEYPEDARLRGVIGANVGITATGDEPVDVSNPTPVKIRSLTTFDVKSRVLIWGLTTFDTENYAASPFRFSRCSYVSWRSCHVSSNTKYHGVPAVTFDGSTGTVNTSYFDDQHRLIDVLNGSSVLIYSANQHGPNKSNEGILCSAAQTYASGRWGWLQNAIVTGIESVAERGGSLRGNGWANFAPELCIAPSSGFPYIRPLKNVNVQLARVSRNGNTTMLTLRANFEIPAETANPDTGLPEAVTAFENIQFTLPSPTYYTPNQFLGFGRVNDGGFKMVDVLNNTNLYGIIRKRESGDTLWTPGTNKTIYIQAFYEAE